jgi:hypothetical protein
MLIYILLLNLKKILVYTIYIYFEKLIFINVLILFILNEIFHIINQEFIYIIIIIV